MKTYAEVKAELQHRTHENLRYFTRAFYATYCKAVETLRRNAVNGIDDSYCDHGIWTHHAWDDVRKTDFYIKSGSAYCQFLCIADHV